MTIDITTQIRIQQHEGYSYTVEDNHIDAGCEGFTVSYWEYNKEKGYKRVQHICMEKEEALALAAAIHKLFKN